ncbi:MAG: hypothetical protein J0I07_00380 [Myxococcales bacterium]|nr:hypothetical protein [Myxococcales bacterium]
MIAPRIAVVQGNLTDGQGTLLANASSADVACDVASGSRRTWGASRR